MNKFQKVSQEIYQQAAQEQQAQGGAEGSSESNEGPKDDNVVDADFTEVDEDK